ncbi:MAG: Rpn family recombination-promoting nuclease/putative transposase [Treponema sp.]|nr:Rpn family recombination-promoting nuclease/putative transposase [Treponema sp.]
MDIDRFSSEEEYVAQMETGALLNPRVDSTFKALFTQPTKESRDALHSFLEAATERKIRTFALTANDAPSGFGGQRGVSYDIMCEFDDGLSADIEMQAFNQEYDYGKRAEYQVARLETTYLRKGDDWGRAPTVYQVSVLDFNYGNEAEFGNSPVSRYAMRTKDGRELANLLNIIFIELPKTRNLEESLETNSALENWAIFLKEADNPLKRDVINRLTKKEVGLMQAQKSLSSISADRDLWIAQYRQEIADRDRRSGLNAAINKGLAQGIEQGIAQGMKQGLEKAKCETAIQMLADNIPVSQIAKWTGLSVSEIEALGK